MRAERTESIKQRTERAACGGARAGVGRAGGEGGAGRGRRRAGRRVVRRGLRAARGRALCSRGFSFERGFVWEPQFEPYAALLWFVVAVRLLSNAYYDLYRLRGEFSYLDECVRVFRRRPSARCSSWRRRSSTAAGSSSAPSPTRAASSCSTSSLALGTYAVLRLAARAVQSAVRRREVNLIPTLVVGRGAEAALCVREMRARRELGYRVIGVVETGPGQGCAARRNVRGRPRRLRTSRGCPRPSARRAPTRSSSPTRRSRATCSSR